MIFPRVLCVKKTTKYERLKSSGVFASKYVEDVMLQVWKEASDVHSIVANSVIEATKASGREVKVRADYLATKQDFEDVDLVMSLGGDGTFLKTASQITTNRLPILGINTDPSRSAGALTTRKVNYERLESDIKKIFIHLDRENFEYFDRQRLHFVMKDVYNK